MSLRVSTAAGERLRMALEVLYSRLPDELRALRIDEVEREMSAGVADHREVLIAEFNDHIVGAALLVLLSDGTGLVFPPVAAASLNTPAALVCEAVEDALLQGIVQRLDTTKAWIGQALVDPAEQCQRFALERNGFRHLTDLKFLSWPSAALATSLESQSGDVDLVDLPNLETLIYRRHRNRLRFVNIIEQSYRGTLDCPEINGLRTAGQALEHHAAAGRFKPEMWRIFRLNGQDVGVLLMVVCPELRAWEIVYLGVIESARRRGIARAMLGHAQRLAKQAGLEQLILAVDHRNLPARRLYESCGFLETATRSACVRFAKPIHQHVVHSSESR